MQLEFTPRKELAKYEWDAIEKNWNRPELEGSVLKKLSTRSNLSSFIRLAYFLGLLAITLFLTLYTAKDSILLSILFLYMYYFIFSFWGALAHELQHKTVFVKSLDWLSEVLFAIAQTFIWLGPNYSRITHRIHHRYTMVKGKDFESQKHEFLTSSWLNKFVIKLLLNLLVIGAIYSMITSIWTLLKRVIGIRDEAMKAHCNEKEIRNIRIESFLILFFHFSVVFLAVYFNLWQLIFLITLAWPIGGTFEMLWHNTQHIGRSYNVNDHRLCTRSIKVNPLIKMLYWGLDDHIEHHIYPIVPSANLPKLHEALKNYIPESRGLIDCWREMYSIAKELDKNSDSEYINLK